MTTADAWLVDARDYLADVTAWLVVIEERIAQGEAMQFNCARCDWEFTIMDVYAREVYCVRCARVIAQAPPPIAVQAA